MYNRKYQLILKAMLDVLFVVFPSVGFEKTLSTVLEANKTNQLRVRPQLAHCYFQSACARSRLTFVNDARLHLLKANVHKTQGKPAEHTFTVCGHGPQGR